MEANFGGGGKKKMLHIYVHNNTFSSCRVTKMNKSCSSALSTSFVFRVGNRRNSVSMKSLQKQQILEEGQIFSGKNDLEKRKGSRRKEVEPASLQWSLEEVSDTGKGKLKVYSFRMEAHSASGIEKTLLTWY